MSNKYFFIQDELDQSAIDNELISFLVPDECGFIHQAMNSCTKKSYDYLNSESTLNEKLYLSQIISNSYEMISLIFDEIEKVIKSDSNHQQEQSDPLQFIIDELYSYYFYLENPISLETPEQMNLSDFDIFTIDHIEAALLEILSEKSIKLGVKRNIFTISENNIINLTPNFKT